MGDRVGVELTRRTISSLLRFYCQLGEQEHNVPVAASMRNHTDTERLLLKHQLSPQFLVRCQRRQLNACVTSLLSCTAGGVLSPIRRSSQMLFLSNWAIGALPDQLQPQKQDKELVMDTLFRHRKPIVDIVLREHVGKALLFPTSSVISLSF